MRVLYFSKDYTPHDWRFLDLLSRHNFDVYYLRMDPGSRTIEKRPVPDRVEVVEWVTGIGAGRGPLGWFGRVRDFSRILNKIQPDLVHAGPIHSCGFLAAVTGFKPIFLVSWGSDLLVDAERNWMWRKFTRFILRRSAALLLDSEAGRAEAKALVDYPDDRITMLPWGVDLRDFRPQEGVGSIRRDLGWETNPTIVSNRNWEKIYGIEVVLHGFAMAWARAPELRLFLLGDGSLNAAVYETIRSSGIEKVVHVPGRVGQSELREFLNSSDLYLSASFSDGTSVSLLEAMACGLPALVTDLPSNREWVTEGLNGWTFPSGNSKALADRLVHAVSDADRLAAAGREALKVARERADWNVNSMKIVYMYHKLAGPAQSPAAAN